MSFQLIDDAEYKRRNDLYDGMSSDDRLSMDERVWQAGKWGKRQELHALLADGGRPDTRSLDKTPVLNVIPYPGCALELVASRVDPRLLDAERVVALASQIRIGNHDVVKIITRYMNEYFGAHITPEFRQNMFREAKLAHQARVHMAGKTELFIRTELGRSAVATPVTKLLARPTP